MICDAADGWERCFKLSLDRLFTLRHRPDSMSVRRVAAIIYAAVSAGVVAFQVALAAGAPWGAYAMGGAFPGQFPPGLRIAALVQAALIVGMAAVVMSRAGLVLAGWSRASPLARVGRRRVRGRKPRAQPDHTQRG